MYNYDLNNYNKILLSVIIVSYNNLHNIKDCLNSIFKNNDIDDRLEVIVVDNSTNSDVYKFVQKEYPDTILIKNLNKGFGQGNNVGFFKSKGRYLLFLNPDTILVERIFNFAISRFEQEKDLGLFGLKLIKASGQDNLSFNYIEKEDIISSQLIKLFHKVNYFQKDKMFITGADMFVRRKAFVKAGMFDEQFFMYYEESDLVKRIKESGYEIGYFPQKNIIHLEGGSSLPNQKMIKIKLDSFEKYCKKYNIDFDKEFSKILNRIEFKRKVFKRLSKSKYEMYSNYLIEIRKTTNSRK